MANRKKAVVVGAGVTGRSVIQALEENTDWDIFGLARRAPDFETRAQFISVDLLDRQSAEAKLSSLDDVTHYFFCGLTGGVEAENVDGNLALLANSLDPIEKASKGLERVVLTQGGKYYGCQIGPHKTPSYEEDPRHLPPNFYYNQEDHIKALAHGKTWTYTLVRPEIVIGFARGGAVLNTGSFVALYATFCRELGVPMHFPGSEVAYRSLNKYSDAAMVGEFEVWCAGQDIAANQAYNITIGSMFRWENVWDRFADYFGCERGRVLTFSLENYLGNQGDLWDEIIRKHGLKETRMDELANWSYADWVMGRGWDTLLDDTKRISHGFIKVMRHEDMFISYFDKLRAEKFIP